MDEQQQFLNWLFSEDDHGAIQMIMAYNFWNGEDSFLEYTQQRFRESAKAGRTEQDDHYQMEMRLS